MYKTVSATGVLHKSIHLLKKEIKIQDEIYQRFKINSALTHILSTSLSNTVLETVTRKTEINKSGIILNRSLQHFAHTDDAHLINRDGNEFLVGFIQLLKARPKKQDLQLNKRINTW